LMKAACSGLGVARRNRKHLDRSLSFRYPHFVSLRPTQSGYWPGARPISAAGIDHEKLVGIDGENQPATRPPTSFLLVTSGVAPACGNPLTVVTSRRRVDQRARFARRSEHGALPSEHEVVKTTASPRARQQMPERGPRPDERQPRRRQVGCIRGANVCDW
jgi:hypothetical protein